MRSIIIAIGVVVTAIFLLSSKSPLQQAVQNRNDDLKTIQKFSQCYFDAYCVIDMKEHVAKITGYKWSTAHTSAAAGSIKCTDFVFQDLVGTRITVTCPGVDSMQIDVRDLYPNVEMPIKPLLP